MDFLNLGSVAGVIYVERKKGSTAVEALKAAAYDIKKTQVLFSRNVLIGTALTLRM
jgi:1-acyl-sn-glycerol-3-phosphate acyltransferase